MWLQVLEEQLDLPTIVIKHPEDTLMGILKRKKTGRARKEQMFSISFWFLHIGVWWNYFYFIEGATAAQKNNVRVAFKPESPSFQNPAYFVPRAASQDILPHPMDNKNKMWSQIQRTLYSLDFGRKDADMENNHTRPPIMVRVGG